MVDEKKLVIRFVSHSDIPDYMGLGDFAVTPVKPIPTKRYCTPIKDGEYWALGLPVVIPSNISDDSSLIERNHAGAILYSFDRENYGNAIHVISDLLEKPHREVLNSRIRSLASEHRNFRIAREVYAKVYGPMSA